MKLIKMHSENRIMRILQDQGNKKNMVQKVLSTDISLEELIYNDDYYFTNFDFLLLAQHYAIPIIIVSTAKNGMLEYYGTPIPNTKPNIRYNSIIRLSK